MSCTPPRPADLEIRYREHRRRNLALILLTLVGAGGVFVLSLHCGSFPLPFSALVDALLQRGGDTTAAHVLHHIRLPRTCAGLLAGAGLGLAGAVMQTVLRNPLASPFTLGVSQGAACGAAFAIIVLGAGSLQSADAGPAVLLSPSLVVGTAFLGAVVTVVVLVLLGAVRGLNPESLVLAGVALSAFFGAATMLLQYFASDTQVAASVFWTFGDLGKARWPDIALMAAVTGTAFLFFHLHRWDYNALLWGDDTARSLGVAAGRLRFLSLVAASLVCAVTIAFLGIIGFVGLLAPHLMRLLVGQDYRYLLPGAALAGGALLVGADILARLLLAPVILPVGILTSFAGVPMFLYLLISRPGGSR
ncbi:MAG: iron ABC transporter permease [Deltaproteobacteria bacterium]|nr:iron ABC transporter permease [Candidatus Anaeroferrophillacea bacterium]